MKIENLQDGAVQLLTETCQILNSENINYIIVGGWSPFLLNSSPINHPGTKDVDILFENGYKKDSLKEIILKFIENDYLLSAKHDFQLFKEIQVSDKTFIYNIDLLHPSETNIPEEIYIDHIDLQIPSTIYQSDTFKMKSIALPSSQTLFNNNLMIPYEINGVSVKLMNEIGTLLTKSQSLKIKKRFRDSLDIYLAITQTNQNTNLVVELEKLKQNDLEIFNVLYGIREFFDEESNQMYYNVKKYIHDLELNEFTSEINDFFKKIGLNELAR
ncbi:MAG: hypothetical protein LBE37_11370 [Sphingobacterium sp.]|jgi:hypothetical protein|nr:hypothetical protein [Sphingobacterium sp.]